MTAKVKGVFVAPKRTAGRIWLSFSHIVTEYGGPTGPHCRVPTFSLRHIIILVYTQHQLQLTLRWRLCCAALLSFRFTGWLLLAALPLLLAPLPNIPHLSD
jgi:hypothetical protein